MIRQMMKKTLLFLCVFMLGATGALAAYPDHPITLVVPFGAGGGTDIPARLLAGMMEKRLGQPIVVQNVSGAGGTLGVAQVAAAKPDGYTLGYVPTGTMCLQPHVMKLPYGTDAFDFIGTSVSQPVVLMTAKNAPWKNINEFIEMAKKNPNKYVVGITATGNMTHVPMLQFAEHFGLKLRFIPYRSGGEIFKDIMAGRTHLHADAPASLSTFDVYGLVQFADERSENLSDIPTTKELGMDARFSHWQGVIAPRGLPKDVLRTLETAMSEVVNSEAFQQEAKKRVDELYMYDVLRADRCISVNSLEARVPFGDLDFVRYVMSIRPELKMNTYDMGKYLLRKAFADDHILPDDILWRQKAAFSDAVGHSMVDDLKDYAESLYSDEAFAEGCAKYEFAKPFTKESLLYRDIFEKYYPGQAKMVKDFWMPNKAWKGCDVKDPSARVLSNYGASGV